MMRILLLALLLVVLTLGCGGRQLQSPMIAPELELSDTEDHRALLAIMEDLQDAIIGLDTAAIRALVSERYYDNAGTTDTSEDDYGFDGLMEVVETLRDHVREVRLEMQIRDVIVDDRRGRAHIIYEFAYTMLYRVADQDRWDTGRDVNRLDFERTDAGWRITRGL